MNEDGPVALFPLPSYVTHVVPEDSVLNITLSSEVSAELRSIAALPLSDNAVESSTTSTSVPPVTVTVPVLVVDVSASNSNRFAPTPSSVAVILVAPFSTAEEAPLTLPDSSLML